jgi:hypothetical protein
MRFLSHAGSSPFRALFTLLECSKTVFDVERLQRPTFDLDHSSDGRRFVGVALSVPQAAIRDWFHAGHDHTGNLPLFPSIFLDQMALNDAGRARVAPEAIQKTPRKLSSGEPGNRGVQ